MPGLILPSQWRQQPQQAVPVDRGDRFGKAADAVFSFGGGIADRISGRTASTNTSTQVVNGRGRAAQFNGAQQFLFNKTEAYSGPYLVAAVAQADTAAGGVGNVGSGINIAAGYSWQLRSNGSTWEFYHLDGSSLNQLASESGGVIAGQPTVLVGLWDGANIKLLRNGVLRATTAVTTQLRTVDRVSLGYDSASGGQFFSGSVNEGVFLRGVFSTADAIELSQNIYRVFKAPTRRIWVSAGAPAGDGVGSATGTSTVTGVGASTAAGVGSAAGTSTASAVGQAAGGGTGVGNALGTSTVSGIGAATAAAAGSAAGTSTATGIAPTIAQGVGLASGISTAGGISANQAGVFGGVPFFHSEYANTYRRKKAEEEDTTPAIVEPESAVEQAEEIEVAVEQIAAPSALSVAKAKVKRELQAELKRQEAAYQALRAKQLEEQFQRQAEEQRNAQMIQELQALIQKDLEEQDEEEAMLLLM
jgi:hypothetical protein